jgi:exonuclease VII small subunit
MYEEKIMAVDLSVRVSQAVQILADAKRNLANVEGKIEAHTAALKQEFGVDTFEAGEALEKKLQAEIQSVEAELNRELSLFEATYVQR